MAKKIGCFFATLIVLLILAGALGIKWFNNIWFKETSNQLSITLDSGPIQFEWEEEIFGEYFEPYASMLVPVRFEGFDNKFYMQFDTGSPYTMLYGNSLESLKEQGLKFERIVNGEASFVQRIQCSLGGNELSMDSIHVLGDYGSSFEKNDTISKITIETIETDFMDGRITLIDFQNEFIRFFSERPEEMAAQSDFKPFGFKGRRIMLPANIEGKTINLFYDSGSSSFGLITSKYLYERYSEDNAKEIVIAANSFGNSVPIHHKPTDKRMEIGGVKLNLKRVSYINKYAKFQRFLAPFSKIDGWLGNKPFIESTLILDTQKNEFAVVEQSAKN